MLGGLFGLAPGAPCGVELSLMGSAIGFVMICLALGAGLGLIVALTRG